MLRRRAPAGVVLCITAVVASSIVAAADPGRSEQATGSAGELEIVDIGTLGGPDSFARDINDRSEVVGESTIVIGDDLTTHAFVWRDGQMTDLGTLDPNPQDISSASAINEQGQIVGYSTHVARFGGLTRRAVMWSDGQIVDLGTLGGPDSEATGINDHGDVVGRSTTASGEIHAFLWSGGRMIDLGTPDGDDLSAAVAINDQGQVVASEPWVWQAGVWWPLEEMEGVARSRPYANNDLGHIVGVADNDTGESLRAIVWRHGAPELLDGFPKDEATEALDINDQGQIVGASYNDDAFLWEDGKVTRLPGLLGKAVPKAINEHGQIAGYSLVTDDIVPQYHAAIWR